MALQLAVGGTDSSVSPDIDYQEPGFNTLGELTLRATAGDKIYLLMRKRTNVDGTSFSSPSEGDYTFDIRDETNGSLATYDAYPNTNPDFSGGSYEPLVIEISGYTDSGIPIRQFTIYIEETATNDFIAARLVIERENDPWGFLAVRSLGRGERPTNSSYVSAGVVKMGDSSGYVILMPAATFSESRDNESRDFSYPLEQIYYRLREETSSEEYDWQVVSYSNAEILQFLYLHSIIQYGRGAVLDIARGLETYLQSESEIQYIDIEATGRESSTVHRLRIYFITSATNVGTSLSQP